MPAPFLDQTVRNHYSEYRSLFAVGYGSLDAVASLAVLSIGAGLMMPVACCQNRLTTRRSYIPSGLFD
jgi:hypothetical protein